MRANHPTVALGLLIASAFLTSCNNNGGGGSTESRLSGTLAMGPLEGATVEIFELLDTGQSGDLLFTTTSVSGSAFEATLRDYEGMVLIRATGGTTTNPATGQAESVPSDHPLIGFADILQGADAVVQVSPLTTLAYPLLVVLCNEPDSRAKDQVENALRMVGNFFGISRLSEVVPGDLTAGPVLPGPAANAAAAIAAIAQAGAVYGMGTMTTVTRIGEDLQDLKGDGMRFGVPFSTGGGPGSLTFELRAALTTFLLAGRGQVSGIAPIGTAPWDAFTGNLNGDVVPPTAVWAMDGAYGDVRETVSARIFLDPNTTTPGVATYEVWVNDLILPVTNISSSELSLDIPAGIDPGNYDICLKSFATGLTTRVIKAINVGDSQATPVVSNFFPNRAPVVGGTLVTFTGDHLYPTTEIRLDGVLVPHVESHAPKRLVVAVPPRTEGVVDVEIRNPTAAPLLIPAGFTYAKENLAGTIPVPATVTPLRIHVTKFLQTPTDGPTLSSTLVTMTPNTDSLGTFLGEERRLSGNAPSLEESLIRSGPAFLAHEIRRRSIVLSDGVSGASDFLRLEVHPRTSVLAGSTSDGIVTAWPVPTDVVMDTVAGRYGVSGLVLDRARALVGQCFGWLEIDSQGLVTCNLLQYARAVSGGTYSVEYIQDSFRGTLAPDGGLLGESRTFPGSLYRGAFEGTGAVGCLSFRRSDFLASLSLQRVEYGQTSRGFGHLEGAAIHQTSPLGVATWQHQSFQRMQETEDDGQTLSLGISQTTTSIAASPAGAVIERAKFQNYFVSPSGIARLPTGEISGLNSETAGNWLETGLMLPMGCSTASADRPLAHGAAIHTDQSISAQSVVGSYTFLESRSGFSGHGPAGGPPTQEQAMRTRVESIVAQNDNPGEWQSRTFNLSGTIPVWELGTTLGLEKRVTRNLVGGVSSLRGVPQVFGAKVLYACVGNQVRLIATELSGFPGRLTSTTEFPHLLGSLEVSSAGDVLLGNEPAGAGDAVDYVFIRRSSIPVFPQGTFQFGFLSEDYEGQGTGPKSIQFGRGELNFNTSTGFTHASEWGLLQANGAMQQASTTGQGLHSSGIVMGLLLSQVGIQFQTFDTGATTRLFHGQITPSGDFGVFLEFTFGTTGSGRLDLIRQSPTLEPFEGTFVLHGRSHLFPGGPAQPAPERLTSSIIRFTPTLGTVNYLGETRTRGNETPLITRQAQFQSAAITSLGAGRGTVTLPGSSTALDFIVSDHGRAMMRPSPFLPLKPSRWVGLFR